MAFTHGRETRVVLNEFNVSPFFNNADVSRDLDTPESTVFGNAGDRTYIVGIRGGTVSYTGFWDGTATTGVDEVLAATLGVTTTRIVTHAGLGFAIGNPVYMFSTHTTNYTVSHPVDGIVGINADIQVSGPIDRGVSLHQLTAETASGNFSSVDNTSSTTGGGIGFLHVTAYSSDATNMNIDISDSTDDAIFVDIINFTAFSAVTSESKTYSGTVDRYLRAELTINGGTTHSVTFTTSFARR